MIDVIYAIAVVALVFGFAGFVFGLICLLDLMRR
jgi:hypothetical protein